MLKIERQNFIMRQLNLHNKVLTTDLCLTLDVSEDTIRRDLNELAENNKIVKVHGGALSKIYYGDKSGGIYAVEKKQIIANKAIDLIKNDMLILTSGGTTVCELIKLLPADLKATFCTVSIGAAELLLKHPNIEVIFIGGKLSKDAKIAVGGDTILKLNEIVFDLCFIGTNGIDAIEGLTDSDLEVVQMKKAMKKASKKFIVLSIFEKLNSACRAQICSSKEIDYLITELEPSDIQLIDYKNSGMGLL